MIATVMTSSYFLDTRECRKNVRFDGRSASRRMR